MANRIIVTSKNNCKEYVINSYDDNMPKFDITLVYDVGDDIEKWVVFHGINNPSENLRTICDYYEEKYINKR